MAYHRKQTQSQQVPALVVMALILFTATADAAIILPPIIGIPTPPTAQIPPPIIGGPTPPTAGGFLNLFSLIVTGRLCCTPNGNCPLGSSGVPGVVVGLSCTNLAGILVQVGQGTTNVNGNFNISVPNLLQTLGNTLPVSSQIPCSVKIPLPLNKTPCPILNTTQGALTGIPSVLTSVTQGPLGLVGIFSVPLLALNATVQV